MHDNRVVITVKACLLAVYIVAPTIDPGISEETHLRSLTVHTDLWGGNLLISVQKKNQIETLVPKMVKNLFEPVFARSQPRVFN